GGGGGGGGLHVAPGVDWGVVHADFVVDVRAGGAAADSGVADHFAALDARAGDGGDRREVRVAGGGAESVGDDEQAAVAGVVLRDGDDAIGGGVHRSAVVGSDVDAGVERAFTGERVEALAEGVGDMPEDGPHRRRIGGVGEAGAGNQPQAVGG